MENTQYTSSAGSREKLPYITPDITLVQIDNEISLTLNSTPPTGDGENTSMRFGKPDNPYHTIPT